MAASVHEDRWFDVPSLPQLFDGAQERRVPPVWLQPPETQIPDGLQFAKHIIHPILLYKLQYKKKNSKSVRQYIYF